MLKRRIKAYPGSKYGYFFYVEIYTTRKSMVKAASEDTDTDFSDARAITKTYRKVRLLNGKVCYSKELGTMFFHEKDFSPEVVAHECGHACIQWAEEKQMRVVVGGRMADMIDRKPNNPDEEEFCLALGLLVAQVLTITASSV